MEVVEIYSSYVVLLIGVSSNILHFARPLGGLKCTPLCQGT